MVNHTVQLINANALEGIHQLIQRNTWVDSIITTFNMDYFYDDTVEETLKNVACHLKAILSSDGTIYIKIKVNQIPLVSRIFDLCGFKLVNILTIPIIGAKIPCHPKKYIDENLEYFLFFTHKEYPARYMNPVEHNEDTCNCKFSANWTWFNGTLIDVYRMMMKISTNHSQVVLDPFMDSGDVGEAAILQDRSFIGIEISKARFDDTKRRLQELGE